MSENPKVAQAANKLAEIAHVGYGTPWTYLYASGLADAGLLLPPRHEEALAACEEYAQNTGSASSFDAALRHVAAVGRASLDAKRPKRSVRDHEWLTTAIAAIPTDKLSMLRDAINALAREPGK